MNTLTENLLAGMQTTGLRRLIYISGAGVTQPEDPWALATMLIRPLMILTAAEVLRDSTLGIERIKASDLAWTIVRAPRLDDSPARGSYRAGYIKPTLATFSRADLAEFVLKLITSNEYLHRLPIVNY